MKTVCRDDLCMQDIVKGSPSAPNPEPFALHSTEGRWSLRIKVTLRACFLAVGLSEKLYHSPTIVRL